MEIKYEATIQLFSAATKRCLFETSVGELLFIFDRNEFGSFPKVSLIVIERLENFVKEI